MICCNWLLVHHLRGPIVIDRGKLRSVDAGRALYLDLRDHWLCVGFTQSSQFRGARTPLNAARSAVVAYPRGSVVGHVAAINVVDNRDVHIVDAAVVVEVAAIPVAALISNAGVAKTVIHIAVEADVRSPVSVEERIAAAGVAPVAGRPKRVLIGSFNPGARNPVVPIGGIVPIARRPNVTVAGARGLLVFRQRRRRLLGVFFGLNAVLRFVGRVIAGVVVSTLLRRYRALLRRYRALLRRWRCSVISGIRDRRLGNRGEIVCVGAGILVGRGLRGCISGLRLILVAVTSYRDQRGC